MNFNLLIDFLIIFHNLTPALDLCFSLMKNVEATRMNNLYVYALKLVEDLGVFCFVTSIWSDGLSILPVLLFSVFSHTTYF